MTEKKSTAVPMIAVLWATTVVLKFVMVPFGHLLVIWSIQIPLGIAYGWFTFCKTELPSCVLVAKFASKLRANVRKRRETKELPYTEK